MWYLIIPWPIIITNWVSLGAEGKLPPHLERDGAGLGDFMKRALKRAKKVIFHYVNGRRVDGPPPSVRGDLTGVYGDLTDCGITYEDRKRGIDISELLEDDNAI